MRILIVEDNQELARSLKKGLELSSYAVDVVYDGKTGEAYAMSGEYAAAIIDWMLPGQTGLELCRAVRQTNRDLPMVLLTAKDTTEQKIEGLDAGADDYLTKPFEFGELLARLRAVLRRPKTALPTILNVGDVSYNTVSHQTLRGGRLVALSVRESAILEVLLRQPNRIFTKEQIISLVWDDDADVLTTTVESHIANLRAKLNEPPIIETVWGRGYTIRDETTG